MNIYQGFFSNLEYAHWNNFGSVLITAPYVSIFLNQVAGNHISRWAAVQWQQQKTLLFCAHIAMNNPCFLL